MKFISDSKNVNQFIENHPDLFRSEFKQEKIIVMDSDSVGMQVFIHVSEDATQQTILESFRKSKEILKKLLEFQGVTGYLQKDGLLIYLLADTIRSVRDENNIDRWRRTIEYINESHKDDEAFIPIKIDKHVFGRFKYGQISLALSTKIILYLYEDLDKHLQESEIKKLYETQPYLRILDTYLMWIEELLEPEERIDNLLSTLRIDDEIVRADIKSMKEKINKSSGQKIVPIKKDQIISKEKIKTALRNISIKYPKLYKGIKN
ncbi:hypothetical protein KQH61_00675 [bacterium]|nr:hypothetical protein [bacterium]